MMKRSLTLALVLCGLSSFLTQTRSAAQALAVANNGKWTVAWTYSPDVSAASEKSLRDTLSVSSNAAAGIGQITVRNLRLTIAEFPRRGLDGNSI
jgi:hypothetical protein